MPLLTQSDLEGRCRQALESAGAAARDVSVLAAATAEAEFVGNRAVGVAHLLDYLDGYRHGRIPLTSTPVVSRPAAGVVDVDATGGLAQVAFAEALSESVQAIQEQGVAALWIRRSFTCGELGYYPRRLAQQGFLSLAMANSPALMSIGGASGPVLGTNPLAYAVPRDGSLPLVIDQASSSTAFVNIRRAAEAGETIPQGWALASNGEPTTDAEQALNGALLPFGSHRGGNIALLVEILATLSGGSFSMDAPPFERGSETPAIGVFVLGVDPHRFPGALPRLAGFFERLAGEHSVRLPALDLKKLPDVVEVDPAVLRQLETWPQAEPSRSRG